MITLRIHSFDRISIALVLILFGLAAALPMQPVLGQSTSDGPASSEDGVSSKDGANSKDRDQLYEELARDVAGLQREFGVLKRVVQLARPTVVHIEASKSNSRNIRFGSRGGVKEEGSGVIAQLGTQFVILTNRHVVKHSDPKDITIKLGDGRKIKPSKVWADKGTDIAVLAVSDDSLIPARFGNSEEVEIGDFVLAFGSPFGLSQSVTYGIVSAKGRSDLELGDGDEEKVKIQNFIQTDAAINPGNSGGPLINLSGEVVGINTAIASSSGGNEGIGFSIPINMVKLIATQMITSKNGRRGFLGVRLDSKFNAIKAEEMGIAQRSGARIKTIEPNTAAEAADLRADDVVLEFEGTRVMDDNHLIRLIGLTRSATTIKLKVFRDGKAFETEVKLGVGTAFETRE